MVMSFLPKMLYSSHLFTLLQKKRSIVLCVISSFIITSLSDSLCYVSQDFWRTQVSADSEKKEKNKWNVALGGRKVTVLISVQYWESGSLFQSFLHAFRQGAGSRLHWRDVRNSEVSPRRESTVCERGTSMKVYERGTSFVKNGI